MNSRHLRRCDPEVMLSFNPVITTGAVNAWYQGDGQSDPYALNRNLETRDKPATRVLAADAPRT